MQCKNSDEESKNENNFKENDFLIYYNWYATEQGLIHLQFSRFKMFVLWYGDKKDSETEQIKVISSSLMTNH